MDSPPKIRDSQESRENEKKQFDGIILLSLFVSFIGGPEKLEFGDMHAWIGTVF